MPNVNIQFGGQTLILPGAYYQDNVSATAGNGTAQVPPLILIGFGYGGKPFTPSPIYTSPQALTAAVRGGPVSAFIPFMTTPSTVLNGASQIVFINAGPNTQSTFELMDTEGNPVIELTSLDYGTPSNLLQISVATGTTGGKLVTLYDGYSLNTIEQDNLGLPFELAYLGTASGVAYSVVGTAGDAMTFEVMSPNAHESVAIGLSPEQYGTVSSVVEYLNGTGFYSATMIGDGTLPSTMLDLVSDVALPMPGGAADMYVPVTATLGAIVYWANQYANTLVTAAIMPGIDSSPMVAPENQPLEPFSGGTNVPPTLANYATAFNAALTIPGWVVFADSNTIGVQALGVQHALTASSIPMRKPRRFVTGSSLGDSITTTVANAQALDAIQATYVYPGITAVSTITGVNTTYSGLYAAAAVAGMMCGNPPSQPLTNVALAGTGVEVALDVTEINQLQQSGVMVIEQDPTTKVPTIVSDLTTWQLDANPENVFNQQVSCRQYLQYVLMQAAQPYTGSVAAPTSIGLVRNAIVNALNQQIYTPGGSGVVASWDPKSLTLTYTGQNQTLAIQVNVTLVGQVRFITIYVPIQPLNLTA